MKKLGIDCRMVRSSGIGSCIRCWLERLIVWHPEWTFVLFGSPADLSEFAWSRLDNVQVVDFTSPIYGLGEQLAWFGNRALKLDLLWTPHYNMPVLWPGKRLVTVHDVAHLALKDMLSFPKRVYANVMFQFVRLCAAQITFDSRFTESEFAKFVGRPGNRAAVVGAGVDQVWFDEGQSGERLRRQRPYLIAVGNIKPHKNLRRLLEAFRLIAAEIPHDLVLVGKREGFITGDAAVISQANATEGRVEFTGYIDDAALRRLVAGSDLLVQPSLYEGFGLPPLEAMAAGCPVAVSTAASIPEVCGDAAAFFDPLDVDDMARVIKEVLTDPELRARLIEKGRKRAETFTWDTSARQLSEIIAHHFDLSR